MTNSHLPPLPQPFLGILNERTMKEQWVCLARQLHEYLGVKDQFPRWMRKQVQKHHLVSEVDYAEFNQPNEFPCGIRYRVEYLLTTKAAAAIAHGIDPAKSDALIHHFDAETGDDVDSKDTPANAQRAQPEREQPEIRRILNTLRQEGLECTELSATALVIEPDEIADWIANPENRISNEQISRIAQACFIRLAAYK